MNAALTPAQLLASLEWRYATKAFDTRKLPDATWAALEESLRLTPSSYGLQPWKFFIISDPAVRAQLRPVSWNQTQVTDASHLIVFARRTEITEKDVNDFFHQMVSERGADASKLEPYRQMMLGGVVNGKDAAGQKEWAARQVYIALGQLMGAAAALAVDTCRARRHRPRRLRRRSSGSTAAAMKSSSPAPSATALRKTSMPG